MMNDSIGWIEILQALFLLAMILFLWPAAKRMWQHSPKGTQSDWMTFAGISAGVVFFVLFLISMVRG